MTQQCAHRLMFAILLSFHLPICPAAETPAPTDPNSYLDAVREFADNVLKYGRDTYGPKHTSLFVDGLNVHTHEPVKWMDPDGTRWILPNLASQQNLFRTLDGLSKTTGDSKYRHAAMEAMKYAFCNFSVRLRSHVADLTCGNRGPNCGIIDCVAYRSTYYDVKWQIPVVHHDQ